MKLGRVVAGLGGVALTLGSIAAGAPIAAVAAGAALAGFAVADAREGRRKRFDQDHLKEADKTVEVYCKQKRQVIEEPTVGVITARPPWRMDGEPPVPLESMPASQFCKIYRIYKDVTTWTEIDVRYRSGTTCIGRGYYCLADGPQNFLNSDVFGYAQVPTTARQPVGYEHSQNWDSFRNECQAVVNYCNSL